ncbi:N4-gp56 family major capsid protein [Salinicoccus albus]|uniref:N4-gp56 family major capsid protein n=1 Tax=Salinicoccus albus TaxID=418756 RepID=UPI000367FB06|nr:N4-gp56 family major capsid protein [Salinicoccus albus]
MADTTLNNMIDPEVLADMIAYEFDKKIRFTPLAQTDNTLQGQPGSTLKMPAFTYIGDASQVEEGESIPLNKLGTESKEVTIAKAGNGVEITDESILSGYGDPLGEATRQIQQSIAQKVDDDFIQVLSSAVQTTGEDVTTLQGLQNGLDVFENEDDEPVVLVMENSDAGKLRIDAAGNFIQGSELGAERMLNGVYGDILGVQIVRSRKLEPGEAYLVKAGALKYVTKRSVQVETDRDIVRRTTVVTADHHYAPYLYDEQKVVKFNGGGEETP